jgi:hypothetical protein
VKLPVWVSAKSASIAAISLLTSRYFSPAARRKSLRHIPDQLSGYLSAIGAWSVTAVVDRDLGFVTAGQEGLAGEGHVGPTPW